MIAVQAIPGQITWLYPMGSEAICIVVSFIFARSSSEHVDNANIHIRRALTCLPTGIEQRIGSTECRR